VVVFIFEEVAAGACGEVLWRYHEVDPFVRSWLRMIPV
jgi:hypothetical protein